MLSVVRSVPWLEVVQRLSPREKRALLKALRPELHEEVREVLYKEFADAYRACRERERRGSL